MNINLEGIYVGYTKGATLDRAFEKTAQRVQEATGLSFSQEEISKASEGLNTITSRGLDNCLNTFATNLVANKKVAA